MKEQRDNRKTKGKNNVAKQGELRTKNKKSKQRDK